ncbi:MAG: fatty acid--CoA ligase family protein [Gemmatimonadota bacterium]|jgi:acyl-coenzyme A synthetase/AMP-(fatty) acid ligase
MAIGFLLERFEESADGDAIVWRDEVCTYGALLEAVRRSGDRLAEEEVEPGSVVSLEADFSPNAVAMLLALIGRACTVVPLTSSVEASKPEFREIAEVELVIDVGDDDEIRFRRTGRRAQHPYFRTLRETGHPGLVLFSSGSTGKSKASVHDFVPLLEKFKVRRHSKRCITFLLFDHIGGVNTLLYNLSNAGCVITVQDRSPDAVCAAIERHRGQILPTSPTFINLLLLSEAYRRHDLSSLELVTYGTEVMPESTLRTLHRLLPDVRLLQTYGLSEVGILRSKSRSSDSLWVKVGGEGYETRVVDGLLEIKSESAMLGYLNADSPFTGDGWFRTGDAVEVDGEYFRFLGRTSEIINVGGEKVYPAEVEDVLQQMDGVEDVAVVGESNPITGQIVAARVKLASDESPAAFRKRMHDHCRERLARYKIPRKVELVDEYMFGERFKKMR